MLKKAIFIVLAVFLALGIIAGASLALADSGYRFETKVTRKAGVIAKVLERINLLARFSEDGKAKYWQKLTDIRLAELKMEVDDKNYDLVDETSSRYSTYLGNYAGFLINKKITSQKETFLDQMSSHLKILNELSSRFEHDSAWWLMLEHDINTIAIFKEKVEKTL